MEFVRNKVFEVDFFLFRFEEEIMKIESGCEKFFEKVFEVIEKDDILER